MTPEENTKPSWKEKFNQWTDAAKDATSDMDLKELKAQLPSTEEVNAWASLIDDRRQNLGETLRSEMQKILEQVGVFE